MSIVVKRPDGRKFVYVKGADSSLFEMTKVKSQAHIDEVERLAALGLRTLVFGYKELIGSYPDLSDLTVEEVESDLTILGVTGVEDLL